MNDPATADASKTRVRVALVSGILIVMLLGWLSVRWQLGNMLSTLTGPADANAGEIARIAIGWAPSDPAGYSLAAATAVDTATAVRHLETSVKLAPHDYRFRVEFARALEQDEQLERAELEFQRAVELAPSYGNPRWHYGNFLLRRSREAEAMAEFKRAAADHLIYRDQVFSLVWDLTNKDAARLEAVAGEGRDALVTLSYFFASRGRAADALRTWNRLSDADKQSRLYMAKAMAEGLFIQRHFDEALAFSRESGEDADADAAPEAITNRSFEKIIDPDSSSRFGWEIARNESKVEIFPDVKIKRTGDRSLKVEFRNFTRNSFANISQTVVVKPGGRYRLSCWLKTENLRSSGPPQLEIVNPVDGILIVRTPPFAEGTNDWREVVLEFTVPETTDGITIRTVREYCGEQCPLNGTIWYDDFELSAGS